MESNGTEIMTFKAGKNLFGLPIANVLSITSETDKLHCAAFQGSHSLGVAKYRGTPVSVIDLARASGAVSANDEFQKTVELLQAQELQHREWYSNLEAAVEQGTIDSMQNGIDSCELDKWLNHFSSDDTELQEILSRLIPLHHSLHQLPESKVADDEEQTDPPSVSDVLHQKSETLKQLSAVILEAISHVQNLNKRVYIYVTTDGSTPSFAIQIDEIAGVEETQNDQLQSLSDLLLPNTSSTTRFVDGYAKLQNDADCLLINVNALMNNYSNKSLKNAS